MSTERSAEQFQDPADLLAELDCLIQDQAAMRRRAKALHAKLVGLRSNGDQYFTGYDPETRRFVASAVQVEYAGRNLGAWIRNSVLDEAWLDLSRECAGQVRTAPHIEQATTGNESGNAIADVMARAAERDGSER
ncbi:hypothetical protein [Nocardia sp. XZ_19_231]|uniref:hypothetical protein n=1 Tax=Nocardia sp. XZ_19_231 TaxID=2769252 RepID=UPI00188E6B5C|nr:hypothetical protein [Nocardia sp. XZ_19_231]